MVNKVWAVLGLVPSSKTFGRHPDDQRCQNLHWVVVQLHTCITLQQVLSSCRGHDSNQIHLQLLPFGSTTSVQNTGSERTPEVIYEK